MPNKRHKGKSKCGFWLHDYERDLLKRERFVKHCLKIRHQVSCVFFYQDLLHVQERLAKDLRRDQRLLFLPAFRQFRSTRISSGPFQIRDQLLQRLITIPMKNIWLRRSSMSQSPVKIRPMPLPITLLTETGHSGTRK